MTAIVTGASSGFGRGIAVALTAAGEHVAEESQQAGQAVTELATNPASHGHGAYLLTSAGLSELE